MEIIKILFGNDFFRELFAPSGTLLKLGDTLKRPKLAATMKKISDSGGSDEFYK